MSGHVARPARAQLARPITRDDEPAEARRKAEGWVRAHFEQLGLELGAIGMKHVKGPIVQFTAQTREAPPRSFVGELDVLRGRVGKVDPAP